MSICHHCSRTETTISCLTKMFNETMVSHSQCRCFKCRFSWAVPFFFPNKELISVKVLFGFVDSLLTYSCLFRWKLHYFFVLHYIKAFLSHEHFVEKWREGDATFCFMSDCCPEDMPVAQRNAFQLSLLLKNQRYFTNNTLV